MAIYPTGVVSPSDPADFKRGGSSGNMSSDRGPLDVLGAGGDLRPSVEAATEDPSVQEALAGLAASQEPYAHMLSFRIMIDLATRGKRVGFDSWNNGALVSERARVGQPVTMKDGSILTVYSTYYEWDCSLQFPASYELMKPDGSVERGQLSAIAPDLEPVPSMDDIEAVDDIDTLDGLLTLTVLKWRYKRRVHDITRWNVAKLPFWQEWEEQNGDAAIDVELPSYLTPSDAGTAGIHRGDRVQDSVRDSVPQDATMY